MDPATSEKPVTAGTLAESGVEIVKINDTIPTSFAVIGERCSGTNLARVLFNKHFNIKATNWNIYGWKHGFPQKISYAPDALIIVLFRDPVDWLKSLYQKPWHASETVQALAFSEFIRAPWETDVSPANHFGLSEKHVLVGQPLQFDRHPISGEIFDSPLALRNIKNQSFLGLANRSVNVAFVKMESLVADPALILNCIAIAFDLQQKGKVRLPETIYGTYKRKVPLPAPVPQEISDNDMGYIKNNLIASVENRLGYFI